MRHRVMMETLPTDLTWEDCLYRRDAALAMARGRGEYVCYRAVGAHACAYSVVQDLERALGEAWGVGALGSLKISSYVGYSPSRRERFVTALLLEAARHYHFCALQKEGK